MSATPHFTWRKLSAAKWEDVWPDRLSEFSDRLAITTLPNGKTIRVEIFELSKKDADRISKEFGGTVAKQNRDWVAASTKPRVPIRIRGRLAVLTSEAERGALKGSVPALVIPAGMAFGTGEHATTLNCLRFLADLADERAGQPWEMLDLGCGSGILALAGRMLGASKTLAGDFDPECVRVTKENVKQNALRGVTVKKLDVFSWEPDRQWEVVTANLYSTILIAIAPKLARSVASGGRLVVSGIMRDQEGDVMTALKAVGFVSENVARQGKWIAAVLRPVEKSGSRKSGSRSARG